MQAVQSYPVSDDTLSCLPGPRPSTDQTLLKFVPSELKLLEQSRQQQQYLPAASSPTQRGGQPPNEPQGLLSSISFATKGGLVAALRLILITGGAPCIASVLKAALHAFACWPSR